MNTIVTENSLELAKFTSTLKIETAIEGIKIPTIRRELGEGNLIKSIMLLVWDAANWFNLPDAKTMTEAQVFTTAHMITEDFKFFSLEDLALAFKNGKAGKYGKIYSSIDGQILLGWLRLYDVDRDDTLTRLNTFATPKEPILPDFIVEDLYKKFALPEIEKEKFNEDEFRKFKINRLKK